MAGTRGTKRKTDAKGKSAAQSKQPKQDGQKAVSKDLNIPIDEGFGDFSMLFHHWKRYLMFS